MTGMTIDLVGWTLINSLWQGSVIALFLAAALRLMRHAGASARYAASIAALGAMSAVPVATTIAHREAMSNAAIGASTTPARSALAVPGSVSSPVPTAAALTGVSAPIRMQVLSQFLETVDVRAMTRPLDGALLWIVSTWLVGVFVLLARLIGGIARTRRFARDGVELLDDSTAAIARRVAARLGIRTVVRILKSTHVDVPMVVGWVAPVVLIPASLLTGLVPVQLEMLLAHELAHIRRYDTMVNLVQRIIETLLFFHPGVWWVSSRVRDERENCCDDLAITITGADRVAYSKALLFVEESRGTTPPLAMAATGGSLLRRVRRLVSGELDPVSPGSRGFATIVSIVAVLIVASTVSAKTVVRRAAEKSPPGVLGIAFQSGSNHVAMSVESAARRGRLEILAVDSAAPVLRNGLNLAPLGVRGDYYLFDSTSFVLVRPASKTFAIFGIVDAAYNFNDGREGWPDVFDIPTTIRAQPVSRAEGATRKLERHGAFHVYWHVDVDWDVPSLGVLSRGRLGVGDAPLGESTVVRWFGPALALAQLATLDSTRFPNDRLGLGVVAPLVGDNASTTNFMSKQRLEQLRITAIDLTRLTLPSDYMAVAIAGSLTESQAKERIAAWRIPPQAR